MRLTGERDSPVRILLTAQERGRGDNFLRVGSKSQADLF